MNVEVRVEISFDGEISFFFSVHVLSVNVSSAKHVLLGVKHGASVVGQDCRASTVSESTFKPTFIFHKMHPNEPSKNKTNLVQFSSQQTSISIRGQGVMQE